LQCQNAHEECMIFIKCLGRSMKQTPETQDRDPLGINMNLLL
jgi:hypothetical protein